MDASETINDDEPSSEAIAEIHRKVAAKARADWEASAALGREKFREERQRKFAMLEAQYGWNKPRTNVVPIQRDVITPSTAPLFELVGAGWDEPLPPIEYAINGLIGKGDVATFIAHGNSGKSWVAYSWAIAIASGRPWLGQFPVMQGRAAILDFEAGEREVRRRCQMLGIDGIGDRLLRASYPRARMHDPKAWAELTAQKIDFVVIDSLSACGDRTIDENDVHASIPLKLAGEWTEHTGGTVLFLHHAGKGEKKDRREKGRGTSAFFADCDWQYEFIDLEKRSGGIVRFTMRTTKDGAGRAPDPIRVELSDEGLRFVQAEAPAPVVESDPVDVPERISLHVETCGSIAGAVDVSSVLGIPEKRAREAIRLLLEQGTLIRGRDRKLYSGALHEQQRRIREAITSEGPCLKTVSALASQAAATRATVEDMLSSCEIVRSTPNGGHFFIRDNANGPTADT